MKRNHLTATVAFGTPKTHCAHAGVAIARRCRVNAGKVDAPAVDTRTIQMYTAINVCADGGLRCDVGLDISGATSAAVAIARRWHVGAGGASAAVDARTTVDLYAGRTQDREWHQRKRETHCATERRGGG